MKEIYLENLNQLIDEVFERAARGNTMRLSDLPRQLTCGCIDLTEEEWLRVQLVPGGNIKDDYDWPKWGPVVIRTLLRTNEGKRILFHHN
jgi:hypothetical protein